MMLTIIILTNIQVRTKSTKIYLQINKINLRKVHTCYRVFVKLYK